MALKLYSKPRRRKLGPEACLQMAVVEYLRLAGVPGLLFFSVPNERKCNPAKGAQLKRMGLLPGVSDLVIFVPKGDIDHVVLFLELKAKGGKQTEDQSAFQGFAEDYGFYEVADNIDDAIRFLEGYGAIRTVVRRRASSPFSKEAA